MIFLDAFTMVQPRERDHAGHAYGCASDPIGMPPPVPDPIRVRIDLLADGEDLAKLLALLASMMPEVRQRAAAQGFDVPALPSAGPPALPQGGLVIDGVLEDP